MTTRVRISVTDPVLWLRMTSAFRAATAAIVLSICTTSIAAQAIPPKEFGSAPSCRNCRITLEPNVRLQLPTDSLSFGSLSGVIRLANGGFMAWELEETQVPVLFDNQGRFTKVVARRGDGPGEMRQVDNVFPGAGDSLWVSDIGQFNWHILAPDGSYGRRQQMDDEPFEMLHLGDGIFAVAGEVSRPGTAGYPLHLVDWNGTVTKSFGVETPVEARALREDRTQLLRWLYPGENGTFWAGGVDRFILEQYDRTGRLLARLRHAMDGWYEDASTQTPGKGDFAGLRANLIPSSTPGLLWLSYYVRNESYVARQSGALTLESRLGQYDIVIEAFDTRSQTVVATQRFEKTGARFVENAPDMLAIVERVDSNFHTLRMHSLHLIKP